MLMRKNGFVADYNAMMDFCKTLEKCNPKNDRIYFYYHESTFSVFAQTVAASVMLTQNVPGGEFFSFGIESEKFLSLWKKLYPGRDIIFKISKNAVEVSEDNIAVKFPTTETLKSYKLPEFSAVMGPDVDVLAASLSICEESVSTSKRPWGVLIDNTGSVGRVVKLGDYSYRVRASSKFSFGNIRLVVSNDYCSTVSMLHKWSKASSSNGSLVALLISPSKVGAVLSSGVSFYMPTMHDAIPTSYVYDFQLQDAIPQVPSEGRTYRFDQKHLVEVLDLVSSVVGAEESMVLVEVDGLSATSKNPVFRFSAKTSNGCEVSELVETLEPGHTDLMPFRMNKAQALAALKCYAGNLFLVDRPNSPVVVFQDEFGMDVTFLLKAAI